jgi:hypothetical protein
VRVSGCVVLRLCRFVESVGVGAEFAHGLAARQVRCCLGAGRVDEPFLERQLDLGCIALRTWPRIQAAAVDPAAQVLRARQATAAPPSR